MLMLLFHVGQDRYACGCEHILEIIPSIELKPLSHMPEYVTGSVIYGGKPLPVIDWCHLVGEGSCQSSFHTRIIIFRVGSEERVFEFGLMAERVTKTMNISDKEFVDSGVKVEGFTFFDKVMTDEWGSTQLINLEKLVSFLQNAVCGVQ